MSAQSDYWSAMATTCTENGRWPTVIMPTESLSEMLPGPYIRAMDSKFKHEGSMAQAKTALCIAIIA